MMLFAFVVVACSRRVIAAFWAKTGLPLSKKSATKKSYNNCASAFCNWDVRNAHVAGPNCDNNCSSRPSGSLPCGTTTRLSSALCEKALCIANGRVDQQGIRARKQACQTCQAMTIQCCGIEFPLLAHV